jgi:hybrid cluster-associated redox disulfide protein
MKIDSKITVSELMRNYPSTVGVFIKRKIPCVGCPADGFHTIEEAALMNGISLENLLKDLRDIIEAEKKS